MTFSPLPPLHPDPHSFINGLLSQNSSIPMTMHTHELSPTLSSSNVNLQRFGYGGIRTTSNPRTLNWRPLTPSLLAQTSNHSHLHSFVHEPRIRQMSVTSQHCPVWGAICVLHTGHVRMGVEFCDVEAFTVK